nr:hypothetical protein [Candidatus Freyrarchaeum guaymaensis]
MTGAELNRYLTLEGVLRVGLPSRPPAEFTPPPLTVDFTVGKIIEAENLEPHASFGFTVENLSRGVLVAGGSLNERLNTAIKIIEGAAKLGWSHLVATNENVNVIKSLVPPARVYDGFPLNPLDPEDASPPDYGSTLALLLQSALGLSDVQAEILQDALNMCYDEGALSLIDLKEKVREASMSDLRSPAERREAERLHRTLGLLLSLKGVEKLTPAQPLKLAWLTGEPVAARLPSPILAAVAQASLMAKALTSSLRGFSVVVELDSFKDTEPLAWVFDKLKEKGVGVLALTSNLSSHLNTVKKLENRVVHKLSDGAETFLAGSLIGLREEAASVQSDRRQRLYQREALRYLGWGEAVVQRSDAPSPMLVVFSNALKAPSVEAEPLPTVEGRTPLQVDFGSVAEDALRVLQLVYEFPQITLSQIVGGLPEVGEMARELALRLKDRGYLASYRDRRGRHVFTVTRKGEEALRGGGRWV